ncbi:MAG: hypothetical protein ACPG6R_11805 [Aequoribacter sp.]|uniref:hypothetical protein n=1 Tax=Aequoribacter sp. TaxID=2847771 RepID=UPI003C396F8D
MSDLTEMPSNPEHKAFLMEAYTICMGDPVESLKAIPAWLDALRHAYCKIECLEQEKGIAPNDTIP